MSGPLTIRGAPFINAADLVRSTPRQNFASEKAKQMMGAGNPLTGSAKRATASTSCPSCGRWHRPGTICPNTSKSETVQGNRVEPVDAVQTALQELATMVQNATQPREPTSSISSKPSMLSQKPEPPSPPSADDQRKQFEDGSQHLRGQSESYLTALRAWQAKYGGQK